MIRIISIFAFLLLLTTPLELYSQEQAAAYGGMIFKATTSQFRRNSFDYNEFLIKNGFAKNTTYDNHIVATFSFDFRFYDFFLGVDWSNDFTDDIKTEENKTGFEIYNTNSKSLTCGYFLIENNYFDFTPFASAGLSSHILKLYKNKPDNISFQDAVLQDQSLMLRLQGTSLFYEFGLNADFKIPGAIENNSQLSALFGIRLAYIKSYTDWLYSGTEVVGLPGNIFTGYYIGISIGFQLKKFQEH